MRDALGGVDSVLVLGGGSEIALATVRVLVAAGARTVVLAARSPERLEREAGELRAAGAAEVDLVAFDADEPERHAAVIGDVFERHGDIDLVLLAFGVLGDAARLASDPVGAAALVGTNLAGAISASLVCAELLGAQGHGTLVVLSSVAGERVRRANFVYGASKAGLDGFAQGLGDHLHGSGVRVMIVRPGFVHTKMTAGLDPPPFSTTPGAVATAIAAGLRRDARTVWAPAPLRLVMAILRHLPRSIFRRLSG